MEEKSGTRRLRATYDYAGIYALNADADPLTLEKMNKTMHADMWGTITK